MNNKLNYSIKFIITLNQYKNVMKIAKIVYKNVKFV